MQVVPAVNALTLFWDRSVPWVSVCCVCLWMSAMKTHSFYKLLSSDTWHPKSFLIFLFIFQLFNQCSSCSCSRDPRTRFLSSCPGGQVCNMVHRFPCSNTPPEHDNLLLSWKRFVWAEDSANWPSRTGTGEPYPSTSYRKHMARGTVTPWKGILLVDSASWWKVKNGRFFFCNMTYKAIYMCVCILYIYI